MAGREPEEYRARRAFTADEPASSGSAGGSGADKPPAAGTDKPAAAGDDSAVPRPRQEVRPRPATRRPAGSSGKSGSSGQSGSSGKSGSSGNAGAATGGEDKPTTILPRVRDDRSTSILPKTQARKTPADDFDDEPDHSPIGRRTRLALLALGVALVAALGLIFGYVALNIGKDPSSTPSPGSSIPSPDGTGPTGDTGGPLLSDDSMMTPAQAQLIDPNRSWQVASTQRGLDADSPRPACVSGNLIDGQPDPQQTILRLLSSSGGQDPPGVLHEADAYTTVEEAAQAYAVTAKAMGGCEQAGAWIYAGRPVTGIGDQSFGLIVNEIDGATSRFRSIVVARTGRVVDIVDVAQVGAPIQVGGVAASLGEIVTGQCATSGGACTTTVKVTDGPPPIGGDQPGFLAAGDLPPVGENAPLWFGDPPSTPDPNLPGSGCETVAWDKVSAVSRTARTYLQQDSPKTFGVDQIIITTESAKDADKLLDKLAADLKSCPTRKLTAKVSVPVPVKGRGADNAVVEGWTAVVEQKAANDTARYRVAAVTTGSKVIFLFSNPIDELDFSDSQFATVAVRSGQRATQVQ